MQCHDYPGHEVGAFEIYVQGDLVHSRLTLGHGRCERVEELTNIVANIRDRLGRGQHDGSGRKGEEEAATGWDHAKRRAQSTATADSV